jgi:uncharacterized protein involved in exopolysaccharide biosynthesis
MFNKIKRDEDFDSSNLVIFLFKWRKPLLIVMAAAMVCSWFFSLPFFITPKYKSTVILFPASSSSVSKAILSEKGGKNDDLTSLGESEQAEQLLQILNSNKIRDRVIRKFNLMEHYGIDSTSKYKTSKLYREYDKNISFGSTEYLAVEISVYDEDPQMAAIIANTIADLLDSAKNDMQRQRSVAGFKIVEAEYKELDAEIKSIVDSLVTLGSLGVNDVEYQSGNRTAQAAIQKKLDILGKYGGVYMMLKNSLEFKTEQLTLLQAKYKEARVDAQSNLPQKFVVSDAYKAERKSYPIRWLIILVSTFSALFLAVIISMAMEKSGNYNSHKKFKLEQS